jgi:formiminotetrahydrofolate cyclodeaminase
MKLQDLTLKEFLEKTASNDAVPGGGCSSALLAAIAASLTEMVVKLTIGRKKYSDVEERMKEIAMIMSENRAQFINDIDRDAVSYQLVMDAYQLPKNSDEEIAQRNRKIQHATKIASYIPMSIAQRAYCMKDLIKETIQKGNINAVPSRFSGTIFGTEGHIAEGTSEKATPSIITRIIAIIQLLSI